MAETTVQEQIVREAPEIEAYKLGLLQLARERANIPVGLPAYQIAGLAPEQQQAVRLAQQGLGSYMPYLQQAGTAYQQAGGMYAGLPSYGAGAIGALQGAGAYSTQQAQEAIRRAAAGADLGLSYGGGAISAIDAASQRAMQQAGAGVGQALASTGTAMGYGAQGLGELQAATQRAGQYAATGLGSAQGMGGTALQAGYSGAQAYDPNAAYAYMNPYQQAATQAALAEIARQGRIADVGLAAQAVRSGAFGGSRAGVQRAELQRNVLEQQARTAAQDYSTNYQQAQQAAMNAFQNQQARMQSVGNLALGAGQLQTGAAQQAGQQALQSGQALGQMGLNVGQLAQQGGQLAGQLGIQAGQLGLQGGQAVAQTGLNVGQMAQQGGQNLGQLGMTAGQLGLSAGQALGQANVSAGQLQQAGAAGIGTLGQQQAALGQMYSGLGQGDVSFMYNLGSQLQGQTQKELDAQRQTALQAQYEPFQRISFLSDIYKGAPSSQQTIAQSTAPSPSLVSQATGLGIAGLSAYNLMK